MVSCQLPQLSVTHISLEKHNESLPLGHGGSRHVYRCHASHADVDEHFGQRDCQEQLEQALVYLHDLCTMKERRQVIDSDLSEREYTFMNKVLEAIKNTDLPPMVLHYFTSNAILKVTAIKGVLFVVNSHLIDAAVLLKLLVQSSVVTFVINDIIADRAFFVKFSVLKSELPSVLSLLTALIPG